MLCLLIITSYSPSTTSFSSKVFYSRPDKHLIYHIRLINCLRNVSDPCGNRNLEFRIHNNGLAKFLFQKRIVTIHMSGWCLRETGIANSVLDLLQFEIHVICCSGSCHLYCLIGIQDEAFYTLILMKEGMEPILMKHITVGVNKASHITLGSSLLRSVYT